MKKLLAAAAIASFASTTALHAEMMPQVSQDTVTMDAAASTQEEVVPLILIGLLLMAAISGANDYCFKC